MYGFSLLICLPDGLSSPAVGRHRHRHATRHAARLRQQAGFRDIEVLPTGEFGFFRFYHLVP